jgi:hypothetical protein
MNVRIEVVCVSADSSEQRRQILGIERQELAMETLGMSLAESKALLAGVQDFMVAQQVSENLEQRRACRHCGRRHTTKDSGSTPVKTLFGSVNVLNPPLEPMHLPDPRPGNIPANGSMAPGANQRRNALPGEQVGVVDPLRKGS